MNFIKLKAYIQAYKDNFESVNRQELYKWKAVKQFQNNWDINAEDFSGMLTSSMSLTYNLLDSGQYFPKRMLQHYAQDHTELLRAYFKELYNEDNDIYERIETFRTNLKQLNSNYAAENDYQDYRAVLVYLALRFPERYYFYKYGMFKEFNEKIEYDFLAKKGKIENIGQYNNLCGIVKHELSQDQELLRLHKNRLTPDCYVDKELNILTQDFIFAAVHSLSLIENNEAKIVTKNNVSVETIDINSIQFSISNVSFTPSNTNHIQNNIDNKRLGDLGELYVLEFEKQQLIKLNKKKLVDKISHDAVSKGDGLGYDILSIDEKGNKKYIEVKTTKGPANSTFFITRTEMERSKIEKENYYLYRVYNFDDKTTKGDIQIIRGDISALCQEPVSFKVKMV